MNARSQVNDYFSATFVDQFGVEGVLHTYASPDDNGSPWSVEWGSCCRISPHSSGNFHVNNPDQSELLRTFVDLDSANSAPRSALPPINACPREAICTIPIPAADREGDDLSFRVSTADEAGDAGYRLPGPPHAPNAATIDPTSGVLTWDTRGATVSADDSEHTLYSVQVMIEDPLTQTPLDFFIEILPVGVTPPFWVMPPTPCGQTLSVDVGVPLTFDVRAASDGVARIVSVSHLGLPLGATFPPVVPGNPASGVFSWTPSQEQGGKHLVVFAAEDDLGYPAPACPVTILVIPHPPPVCVAPTRIAGIEGVPISYSLSATTPNASRVVTLTLESGPVGLDLSTIGPGNPTSGSVSWPAPYNGAPSARIVATDSGGVRARCTTAFDIGIPSAQAFTLGAWAGTAVPVAAEYSSGGHDVRAVGASASDRRSVTAVVDHPQIGLHAEGITEWAGANVSAGVVSSYAGSEIASLSLANGAVQLHGIRQEVSVTWGATGASSIVRNAHIARLVVNGQEVPVSAGSNMRIPFPGGYVSLFETNDSVGAFHLGVEDQLVHVYVAPAFGRHEAILGSVIVQAGGGFEFRGQSRSVHAHDDLRSGADAGPDAQRAMSLSQGVHDANMPIGDGADAFLFPAAHGEKIVFVAQPAPGVYATGGSLVVTDTPPPFVGPPALASVPAENWLVRLYDPTGALREESLALANGGPARVELNADIPGDWVVVLERSSRALATNYTLALSVTPIALLPQNDALALGDAAPACVVGGAATIPFVQSGLWPGVVRDDDFADVYRFRAEIGELVAVALKPGEDADGAAMGLRLYDRDCTLVGSMDQLTGLVKGEPRVALALPSLYSGDYFVQVARLNGVANHYVQIDVVNPMPAAPMNDALTGADASADPAQATAPPPGAFQGHIHEGDTGDAYTLAFTAGRGDAYIGFSMSALSYVDVRLYDPNGIALSPIAPAGSTAVVWNFEPLVTGAYKLVVTPQLGGGNYSVVWGQSPTQTPEP